MVTHSSILALRIPWIDTVGYSPWGRKESDMAEQLSTFTPAQGASLSSLSASGQPQDHMGFLVRMQ